jgi:hypothetical protein
MRIDLKLRSVLFATTAAAALVVNCAAAAFAGDTEALVTLLASKGVISSSEARTIASAPAGAQEDRLVALLRKKGVLAEGDVKKLQSRPRPVNVASTDPNYVPAPPPPAPMASAAAPGPVYHKAAVTFGGIEFSPVGYIAFTSVTRSTNTGNATATNFGAIPFDNQVQGTIGETRLTAQNTRLGLRAHGAAMGLDLTGYFEGDFNGNDPANVFVNSNSHTFRMRLAYADVNSERFEASFGQMYSWITPNRHGIGPDPRDVFLTNNVDINLQVGLPWARQAGVHLVWHATPGLSFGVGAENPQQFTNGEVIIPFAFNAQLGGQFDSGAVPGVPNQFPDVVAKGAYDGDVAPRARLHLEAAGMWRHFEATVMPTVTGSQFTLHDENGWVATAAANLELFKTVTLLGNAFWSSGGGRYLNALGPDVVVLPTSVPASIPGSFSAELSAVRSHGFLGGFEWLVHPTTVLSGYYGQASFENNFAADFTNPQFPNFFGGPFAGFGGPNSANNNNKRIEEWTADLKHTFWANPRYGSLVGLAQYSYVRREPWFVAAGAPTEAHAHMVFTEARYVFPDHF